MHCWHVKSSPLRMDTSFLLFHFILIADWLLLLLLIYDYLVFCGLCLQKYKHVNMTVGNFFHSLQGCMLTASRHQDKYECHVYTLNIRQEPAAWMETGGTSYPSAGVTKGNKIHVPAPLWLKNQHPWWWMLLPMEKPWLFPIQNRTNRVLASYV